MNEINLNGLRGASGIEKNYSVSTQKNIRKPAGEDSVELTSLPDLSAAEAALEAEFASARAKLQDSADSESYPPLETIDRLAAMFAMNLDEKNGPIP